MTFDQIIECFQARRAGANYMALCPAHADKNPSLAITEKNGRILLKCFAGCSFEAILTAANLQASDLFMNGTREAKHEKARPIASNQTALYNYCDEAGKLLFQIQRFEQAGKGKNFQARRPDGSGGWLGDLDGVRLVPYNLPAVIAAENVLVVEGEKDVDTASDLGIVATCNPFGAGKWRDEYSECLRAKNVTIIPDADEPGRQHAEQVAKSLAGKAASIAICPLPKPFKDLSDWSLPRESLIELIKSAKPWTPGAVKARPRAVIYNSREYLTKIFPPREPLVVIKAFGTPVLTGRSINQIFGWRGTGKSMFAQALAGHIATGTPFLNFEIPKARRVLYVDGELPSSQIQGRMRLLHPPEAFIELLDLESQDVWGIPHLHTLEGQRWLETELEGVEVLILDSQATLAPFSVKDSEAQSIWNNWLIRLRARGLCVVTLHQAGKLGGQRLTSANDDPLDIQIKLSGEENEERDHLKCTLHYEKFRAAGRGCGDLNLEFQNGVWKFTETLVDKFRIIEEFFCLHPKASIHKLADEHPELGSLATVKRMVRKWKDQRT